MFNWLKSLFKKKPFFFVDDDKEPIYKCTPTGRYVPFFSEKEFKEWQDQCDAMANGTWNPLGPDISICIPGHTVSRDGEIFKVEIIGWKPRRWNPLMAGDDCTGGGWASPSPAAKSDNVNDTDGSADQHGKEVPNGN